jgi:hypothetical protein
MTLPPSTFLGEARRSFHAALLNNVLHTDANGIPTNADSGSRSSVAIAKGIVSILGSTSIGARLVGQMSGNKFEVICKEYLEEIFPHLNHLRPGNWTVSKGLGSGRPGIAKFDQYEHLAALDKAARANPALAAALGSDYFIKPDIVIFRQPESDAVINVNEILVGEEAARLTSLRKANSNLPILHASISCKWTIRSDRSQNSRSEGLNLIRNRKGRLPHIAVVTGEPTPNRIASIALGTGDIDCVYHFALPELVATVKSLGYEDAEEMLDTMIKGKRLRDIADLPLDLVV